MATFSNGESGLSVRTKINNVLQHADGTSGELVINDAGADVDFRVESDTNANAFFLDGATGNVGIGTSSPSTRLTVVGSNPGDNTSSVLISGSTSFVQDGAWEGPLTLGWTQNSNDGSIRMLNIELTDSGSNNESTYGIYESGADRNYFSGNVGIGTSSPSAPLHVTGSGAISRFGSTAATDIRVEFAYNSTDVGYISAASSTLFDVRARSGNALTLGAGNAERMRIDASGNVGIGTSSPNVASIVDAQSTTKGVRFPNMTTTQKNAIANVAGNVIFDTTLGKLCVNSGSGWETITSI
jgi:hypothetical protein